MHAIALCDVSLLPCMTVDLVKIHADFKKMLNIVPEGLWMINPNPCIVKLLIVHSDYREAFSPDGSINDIECECICNHLEKQSNREGS